jgi:hypothetical protein
MIKVGDVKEYIEKEDKNSDKKKKVAVLYTYRDVKFDLDGWADSKEYLPEDYNLVYMKIEGRKTIPGWSIGSSWSGLRLKLTDQVIYWKRQTEEKE